MHANATATFIHKFPVLFKGQLKWKILLDKYVYLLMQCTKQHNFIIHLYFNNE